MRGDLEWGSVPLLVQQSGERYAGRDAVVDGPVRLSFADLAARVRAAAAAATAAGVEPGDRVALWAPNDHRWVVAALGLLSAGAALVPLNTRFKGAEAAYVLRQSGVRLLVVADAFLGSDYLAMLRAEGRLPELRTIVLLAERAPSDVLSWPEFLASGASVPDAEVGRRLEAVTGDDLCDVIFTSGTTGRPKGVVVTHAQTLRVYQVWSDVVGLAEGDRYLVVNPFFHTFGYKAGIIACLMRGATILPHAVFDVAAVMRRVTAHGVTVLPGPPTLYQSILDAPDRSEYDLGSLRLAVTGAAVVPVRLVERMCAELSFETVLTAYGLTEACGTATMCRRDDDAMTIATTSGRAIPDTEVRVVSPDGRALPAGRPGEVVVRGYNVMRGYFRDPDATAQAIDADGWLHTGDIGVMDDRGYLRITDRLKDMFVVGGFNAYPAEIEQTLAGFDGVSEVAVVGVPDDRLGEVGKAYVVPRPGGSLDPRALLLWCRERMANYKVPRHVEVVDALPRNASGKVLKQQLRARE